MDKAVGRLLPPERASLEVMSREMGIREKTLEVWRGKALAAPGGGGVWTAQARLEAVITTAAMNAAAKSVWCREHGVNPADPDKWCASCNSALADPEDA